MAPTAKLHPALVENVPLAALTTLGVGGPARYLARCGTTSQLADALAWARARELPVFVLGGGSNLLVADAGFDGLVVELTDDIVELDDAGGGARLRAAAGVDWDALVARAVGEGLAGLECLSGIPGRVGAAPIQNVGAYGQEVAETLAAVEVVELATGARRRLAGGDCGFAYRQSHFKGRWRGRYAITRVDFRLARRARGTVRYRDLEEHLRRRGSDPAAATLAEVRAAVLTVRHSKSMVLDPDDPNRRSAGSFFLNPVVTPAAAAAIGERWSRRGGRDGPALRTFATPDGRVKLAAAQLIEQAGFGRGYARGRAGLSTRHTLALVNRGGATARELVALAAEIRAGVAAAFGVVLHPEPVFLGFEDDDPCAFGGQR